MDEKKIRRLRFDNLNGNTPLQRMTVWLRHWHIRNLALFSALILAIGVEVLILLYFSRLNGEDRETFLSSLVILSYLVLIYLPVWFWMLILVIQPDKCYGMRKLKRLGNMDKFAGELEEELSDERGVLFQKNGICVTKRFIIEASFFYFRVYPLDGLLEMDSRKARPTFCYENGTRIKMATKVPIHILKPYIRPEAADNREAEKPERVVKTMAKKPKLRKRDIIISSSIVLCIAGVLIYLLCFKLSVWETRTVAVCCCCVLLLLLAMTIHSEIFKTEEDVYREAGHLKRDVILGLLLFVGIAGALFYLLCMNILPEWGTRAAALCCCGALLWLLVVVVLAGMKDRRLMRMLLEIEDLDERIRKMEEFYAGGVYKNRVLYLNQLSTVYYDNQDAEKALELVREAYRIQSSKRESRAGSGMSLSNMLKLNEIIYLMALDRRDEAEPLLATLDDKPYKDPLSLYLTNATRTKMSIWKGDVKAAREYLHRMDGWACQTLAKERQVNIACHLLLLEVECDLLEQDTASVLVKLDDVLTRSTWPPNNKRAAELKEIVRRKRNGFRARHARRHAGLKHVAAHRHRHRHRPIRRRAVVSERNI